MYPKLVIIEITNEISATRKKFSLPMKIQLKVLKCFEQRSDLKKLLGVCKKVGTV